MIRNQSSKSSARSAITGLIGTSVGCIVGMASAPLCRLDDSHGGTHPSNDRSRPAIRHCLADQRGPVYKEPSGRSWGPLRLASVIVRCFRDSMILVVLVLSQSRFRSRFQSRFQSRSQAAS